jgi:hypothetical protein
MDLFKQANTYSYETYKEIVFRLADEGKSSGEENNERIAATSINKQRIKRIDKQCILQDELAQLIAAMQTKQTWFVLTESWCGDGAQSIPVLAKMAAANPNIEIKLLFRDEHVDIMDVYLTNGSRSVPKLIIFDNENNKELLTWGPRPKAIQAMVHEYKQAFPTATHDEFVQNLHLWYARDKTNAIQNEFKKILKDID